jgi:hypothetical protein
MDNTIEQTPDVQEDKHVLGNDAEVKFMSFNRSAMGKVDTGATTSSLHATDITMSKSGSQVSFNSPVLSNNLVTVDVDSHQEVHSADGGGQERPVVKLEIEIDGVNLGPVEFNLNDRSEMDSPILIGQNILEAGNFVIDVKKEVEEPSNEPVERSVDYAGGTPGQIVDNKPVDNKEKIREAIRVLRESNVTLSEMMMYIQTEAIQTLEP